MHHHPKPAPVARPFWTPGVLVLVGLMTIAGFFILGRFLFGLGAVTNLKATHPWGLWIGIDVATGVALAAGGFTTAALAHIFGRHYYEAVTRPALLTAMLGYTFVSIGLAIDIGRSWAIWKPIVFWQPNSVLFEVAMCVVIYLHVLYIEFIPVVADRFGERIPILGWLNAKLDKVMWVFIILGVVLSCMHQSGLGSLMLIAPAKVHPLWYTPILPLLFLLSAVAVGYPMVVFETTIATTSLKLESEMEILTPLTRITVFLLGIYLFLKVGDMLVRGSFVHLGTLSAQSVSFLVELIAGVVIPWLMLLSPAVRRSRRLLFMACALIVGGVALNRVNVFLVSYNPPYAESGYFPSVGEIAITAGLIAGIIFLYRAAVTFLPVLSARPKEVSS
jgi:Ni/Fe-hydrogenase subunit HybB-like protein